MNEKIELWFPTPIYYVDNVFGDNFKKTQQLFLNHNFNTIRNDYMNVESSYISKTSNTIHHIEKFKYVFDKIEKHVYNFAKHMGYINNLKIDNSWINHSIKNDYLYPHIHSGSLISGAYYIKSNEKDKITFTKNIMDMKLPPDKENNFNQKSIDYPCISDRLILFLSDTLHMTFKQKANEKMTLSFNYKYWYE